MSTVPPARLLWDQAGLWSLMALEAVRAQGLAICPVTAAEVAAGGLAGASLLVVPGGWPALKKRALGQPGAAAVRAFVARGGRYLGFCGGAGLALAVDDGLGLVELGRASGRGRLPSLSGPVRVSPGDGAASHPFWDGLGDEALMHVWWPGQFSRQLDGRAQVVASYDGPGPGLCSADLVLDQVAPADWPGLEEAYGLRLDPRALWGQPAVIESSLGRGSVCLSYLHLDTPGDPDGGRALGNLWRAWLGSAAPAVESYAPAATSSLTPQTAQLAHKAHRLWSLGRDLGLWRPRTPAMPLWRRGARGLELWSLVRLCEAVDRRAGEADAGYLQEANALLEPVWRQGPAVLEAQAASLVGRQPSPEAASLESAWFPRPRRIGGPLAEALAGLELLLLRLERNEGRED